MATYYIKNGGNDSADGLSDATAWATVSKVQNATLNPGDSVLFARGSKWRSRYFVNLKSGTEGAPITIGAYGAGDKPELIGSNLITGWVSEAVPTGENFTDGTGSAPVAYWNLTETSGNRVSAAGDNALVPSTIPPTKGVGPGGLSSVEFVRGVDVASSQSLSLPQSSMSASFPCKEGSASPQPLTWGAWVRIDAATGTDGGIMGMGGSFHLVVEGGGIHARVTNTSGSTRQSSSTTSYTAGQWVHYVGRFDSSIMEVRLFINGVKMAAPATPNSGHAIWADPFTLGTAVFKGNFTGAIAQPFVFNTALTDAQILSISQYGLTGTFSMGGVSTHYYAPLATSPGFVYLNDARLSKAATKASLTSNSFFYDDPNDRLYVQTALADNPTTYTVEACVRDYCIRPFGCDYMIVQDLRLRDAMITGGFFDAAVGSSFVRCEFYRNTVHGSHLFAGVGATALGFKYIDCVARDNGACGITVSGDTGSALDGVLLKGCETYNNSLNLEIDFNGGIRAIGREVNNFVVEDCHIHDEGYNTDLSRGCGIWLDTVGVGGIVRRNLVERTTSWGIQVEDCNNTVVESNVIEGTIHFAGIGIIRNCDGNIARNNTLVDCVRGFELNNFGGSHFAGNQVYNNVVVGTPEYIIDATNGVTTNAQVSFNKNAFGPERANFVRWNGLRSTYADWETALGASTNSFTTNVTFVDAATGNYRLTDASVGKNAGAPLPFGTLDFTSVMFNTSTPSIGAYENVILVPKPTKAEYKTKLAALRASLAASGTFSSFGVFPLMHQTEAANSDSDVQRIRQAHYEYITENPSTINLGWTPDVALSDSVNQTAAGSETISYAYAHALLYGIGAITPPSIGPKVTGVTRNGAVLTLAVTHNGGDSLKTQTGGTPTGFQVFPIGSVHSDGAALAISAISLGANTITITLAADPGSRVDVYYQYGKFDNTAPVYDNSTALGRTVGNALQPLMAPVTSPVETAPLTNPALKLNGTDSWVRWSDSVRWDTPDADWTMAVFAKINSTDPNGAATTSYLLSGGNYGGVNSFNLLLHESNAGSGNANKVEFSIRGAGATVFTAKPATADLTAVNANWRWWVMEFVKSTETINVYYCNINGARTLYATIAAPALGIVGPTTGPAFGTRAPPAVGSGLYLNGGVYEFVKLNGLLTATEVAQMATGVDVRTGLGKTTQIHHYFRSLSTPIADAAGTGLAAALNGPVELYEGPIYT